MDEKRLAQLRKRVRRQASRLVLGGDHRSHDPAASWFGRVAVGLSGEDWPRYDDRLMWPLCQIACAELPCAPPELVSTAYVCVFVMPAHNWGLQNGDGWLLRTYGEAERSRLVQLEEPEHGSAIRPFPVEYERIAEDWPGWEDFVGFLTPDEVEHFLANGEELPFESDFASKVGDGPPVCRARSLPGRSTRSCFRSTANTRRAGRGAIRASPTSPSTRQESG